MKLTDEHIKNIVAFWLYVLPNGIDKTVFKTNLENLINISKGSLTIDAGGIYGGVGNLAKLVNGNAELDSANPDEVLLHKTISNNWPLQGLMSNECQMIIEKENQNNITIKVSTSPSKYEPLENFLNQLDLQSRRGAERNVCAEIPSQKTNNIGVTITILNAKVTSGWPRYDEFIHARRKNPFSREMYSKIIDTVDALEKEFLSSWPYPNKDRKLIKIKALGELVSKLYNFPYKPEQKIVAELRKTYPQAILGQTILGNPSNRVNSIFETLAPPTNNLVFAYS